MQHLAYFKGQTIFLFTPNKKSHCKQWLLSW